MKEYVWETSSSLMDLNSTRRRQMAALQMLLIFLVLLSNGVYSYEVDGISKDLLDIIIKDKHLEEDGYSSFQLAEIHEIKIDGTLQRSSTESIRRRKRSLMADDLPLNLTFTAFHETFKMAVKFNTELFPPGLSVIFFENGNPSLYDGEIPDCLLQGRTAEHGIVALQYCEGITGSILQGDYIYRLDPIGQMGDYFNETILVSKALRKHQLRNVNDYTDTIKDDILSKRNITTPQHKTPPTRHKRQTYPRLEVEMGVYVDEIFYALLETKGATTRENKIKFIQIKWNMAQAMLNIPAELGYEVVLVIKGIEFWDSNPAWFTFTLTDISATMADFWAGVQTINPPAYDNFHLHTGTKASAGGLAALPGTCVNSRRVSVSSDVDFYDGYIVAHEIGHTFGMQHDTDIPCAVDPIDGFMATVGYKRFGWSSCSKDALHNLVTTGSVADCFNFENVPAATVPADVAGITFNGLWPGMAYSPDQICELDYGAGWRFRPYFMAVADCGVQSCYNANEGPEYGTMVNTQPKYGSYCGVGKVCNPRLKPKCLAFADTKVPVARIPVVAGGWSAWGPVSACSRTCGTGLMVKARTCTNPVPLNTGQCVGSYYEGEICNTDPCPTDPTNKGQLIKLRAGETCQRLMADGILPAAEYDGTGAAKGSSSNVGRCEVKCINAVGFTTPATSRFAFFPDGTPCTHDTLVLSDREKLGYIRGRDYKVHCIRGNCEIFGCDNLNGVKATDLCGVCGGDTSTCTPVDKMYCEPLALGERVTIVTIPAGATQLLFYFTHSKMKKWYVELYTTADEVVMASKIDGITNTGDTPVNKAGADWHFWNTKQYLWSIGPTNQDLVLKITLVACVIAISNSSYGLVGYSNYTRHLSDLTSISATYGNIPYIFFYQLFNSAGLGSNQCVHIGFSLPTTATIPVFVAGTQDDAQPAPEPEPTQIIPTTPAGTTSGTGGGTTSGTGGGTTSGTGGGTTSGTDGGTTSGTGGGTTSGTGGGTTSGTGGGTTSGTGGGTTSGTGGGTTSGTGGGTTSGTGGGTTNSGSGTVAPDTCQAGRFYCPGNQQCFSYEDLCDGENDCPDKSDEINIFCKSAASAVHTGFLFGMVMIVLQVCLKQLQ